jgi:hypothetical protein
MQLLNGVLTEDFGDMVRGLSCAALAFHAIFPVPNPSLVQRARREFSTAGFPDLVFYRILALSLNVLQKIY